MNILISCIPFDSGKSGISVYIRNLVQALSHQGHKLTLIVEPSVGETFFQGYNCITAPSWTRRAIFSMLWHLFILPFKINKADYDFCIIAAANRRAFSFYPLPTIAVVHDLSQYHVPAKYDAMRMFYIKKVLPFFVRKAMHILAISKSTAADLVKYWHVQQEKIHVIYNGLNLAKEQRNTWLDNMNLKTGSYLLYISRIESPGKNHLNLIKAYEKLNPELTERYKLILAGSDWDGAQAVHQYAKQSHAADRIIFTGFLDNRDLVCAYTNAAAYVFPSFFEGFGLSLIEAMHYGIPCACSNTSSLGEIGEGAAILFNPESPDSIADALTKLLTDASLRNNLMDAGRKRASDFSWEKHARQIVAIFNKTEMNHD